MFCRFSYSVLTIFTASLLTFANTACSQEEKKVDGSVAYLPSLRGDYFSLHSAEVGRKYHIYVRLPEGYEKTKNQRFPTVYLLDGDSTFPMLAPLHLFMHYDDQIPETIIVGIAYGSFEPDVNMRHFDFRTVMDDGSRGGALQFLSMLEKELIPRIDRRFRTDPARRVLVGQSRGGSAVLQAAWLKPRLSWAHIASNPGREPDTKLLYGMDRDVPASTQGGYLIVASGSHDRDYLRGTALEWRDRFASRADLPWKARFIDVEGGTHAADLGNAYRAAMKVIFDAGPEKGNN
ncbi:alpha/beta hydrolase [Sphingobium subterraneum]|uniref:Esterase n=1 Tax=Sphingobium subterraneum TaxID=627688 RepID=A0A841J2A1_9SPHN|nr:alpha/beta hydrolase-fold protein [Sphingobium subterraneum]MBB6122765.1 hypothetical protein [Sphingobium subterraneum]